MMSLCRQSWCALCCSWIEQKPWRQRSLLQLPLGCIVYCKGIVTAQESAVQRQVMTSCWITLQFLTWRLFCPFFACCFDPMCCSRLCCRPAGHVTPCFAGRVLRQTHFMNKRPVQASKTFGWCGLAWLALLLAARSSSIQFLCASAALLEGLLWFSLPT